MASGIWQAKWPIILTGFLLIWLAIVVIYVIQLADAGIRKGLKKGLVCHQCVSRLTVLSERCYGQQCYTNCYFVISFGSFWFLQRNAMCRCMLTVPFIQKNLSQVIVIWNRGVGLFRQVPCGQLCIMRMVFLRQSTRQLIWPKRPPINSDTCHKRLSSLPQRLTAGGRFDW